MKYPLYPKSIIWEITAKCNLKCRYCSANGGENGHEMKLPDIFKILNEIIIYKESTLFLSGGEPLLRKDIFEILYYVKERRINTVLLTNGLLLNKKIISRIKNLGIKIQIGFDSLNPTLHDFLRGREGAFAKSLNSLKEAIYQGLEIGVAIIATKLNFKEIPCFIDEMIGRGVNWICIPRFIPCGRGAINRSLNLSIDDRIELIKSVVNNKYYKENKIFFDDPTQILFTEKGVLSKGCNAGINKLLIDPSGSVMPCPMFRLSVGSVRETSIQQIWNKAEVLNNLRSRKNIKGECRNCIYLNKCGGCRGLAYHVTGDYLASDILCPRINYFP